MNTSDTVDINAAYEMAHNLVDAARTAMAAARKLHEVAEALQQATQPSTGAPPRRPLEAKAIAMLNDLMVVISDMRTEAGRRAEEDAREIADHRDDRGLAPYYLEFLAANRRRWGLDEVDRVCRDIDQFLSAVETAQEGPE